ASSSAKLLAKPAAIEATIKITVPHANKRRTPICTDTADSGSKVMTTAKLYAIGIHTTREGSMLRFSAIRGKATFDITASKTVMTKANSKTAAARQRAGMGKPSS